MQFTNYQLPFTNYLAGFTLVELLVAVSIMTMLSAIAGSAIPRVRTHQALKTDTQQLRSLFRNAQQRAMNEVRTEDCLANLALGEEAVLQRRCSNIGIAMPDGTNRAIMFADLDGDRAYRRDIASYDLVMIELDLRSQFQGDRVVVFESKPPFFEMYSGSPPSAGNVASIALELNDVQQRLELYPYGQLEEIE